MRTTELTVLIALGLSLAGCGSNANTGVDTIHQPVVSRSDYVLDVDADGGSGLSNASRSRLNDWFQSLQLAYGDRVAVDLPDGYENGAARASVAAIADRYGLLLEQHAPITTGEVPSGSIRIVVSRMKATVPGCPDWSGKPIYDFHSKTASNFGCAVNSNLAAMIADPQDLITGRASESTSSSSTAGKAIKTFRETAPTGAGGLKSPTSGGVK
jgi:pilus assembly protein CpaD